MSAATLGEAFQAARTRIHSMDAGVLLCHVIGRDPAYLIAHPEMRLRLSEQQSFDALVERRVRGEPVAYLTGQREFYGRTFRVTPAVLIPRPETELLVDVALERTHSSRPMRVLDLGTGSGCIAIAIASERSHCKILATDQSVNALAVARRNAVDLGVANVSFLESDWFSALERDRFDLIVSNPPYVAEGDLHLTQGDLRFEPSSALESGADGLDAIRRIVAGAGPHLNTGGTLLLEHGYDQASAVRNELGAAGFEDVFSRRDLAGIERVSGGRLTTAVQRR